MSISATDTSNGSISGDLEALWQLFGNLFNAPQGQPPKRIYDNHIPLLDDSQVIKIQLYRCPVFQKAEIERTMNEIKTSGIRRASNSPFASPMMLVKKKDGSWHLCIDYQQLNKITIKDKFPMPLVEELANAFKGF